MPKRTPSELKQIRWHCRRGMLELDMLLHAFMDDCFESLSDDQQEDFIRLLDLEDQRIWSWVLDQSQPDDQRMQTMIDQIKSHWSSQLKS